MKYKFYSYRYGLEILQSEDEFKKEWEDLIDILNNISEQDIILHFQKYGKNNMSISTTLNKILKIRFKDKEWKPESAIFSEKERKKEKEYNDKRWRLDFAKENVSVEVAFNHGEAVAWNLTKPLLASELNHVEKEIQTKIGIVITATDEMKKAGGFDNSIGSYEKYIRYLKPMSNILTVPMLIIGLDKPDTFRIDVRKNKDNKNRGHIVKI